MLLPGGRALVRPALYARVLAVLGAMVQAGALFGEALMLAAAAAGLGALGRQLLRASERVRGGQSLGEALRVCTRLPFKVRSALLTADQVGAHESTLGCLTVSYEEAWRHGPARLALTTALVGLGLFGVLTLLAWAAAWSSYYHAIFERAEGWMS